VFLLVLVYTILVVAEFDKIEKAESFLSRFLGLMGRRSFGDSNGVLLKNTNSIHTFFVFFPIDVVFLSPDMKVLKLIEGLSPFWISPFVWQAKHTLELPAGTIKKKGLEIDDKVHLL
jgi:hypothetical protein